MIEARREALAQSLAHSAVAGQNSFSQEEAEYLVTKIIASAESFTPQGKPIMAVITSADIKNRLE